MSTGTKAMEVIAAVSAEPSETESACSGLYVAPRNSCDRKLLSGATEQNRHQNDGEKYEKRL